MTYHEATIKYGREYLKQRQAINEAKHWAVVRYQRMRVNCECSVCREWRETPTGQIWVKQVEGEN